MRTRNDYEEKSTPGSGKAQRTRARMLNNGKRHAQFVWKGSKNDTLWITLYEEEAFLEVEFYGMILRYLTSGVWRHVSIYR